MTFLKLAARRGAARKSLLGLVCLTIAFIAAVLSGITGYTQLAATDALRNLAGGALAEQGYARIHTTVADDPAAQSTAANAAFTELRLDAGLLSSETTYSVPRTIVPSGGTATNLSADLSFLPVEWKPTTTTAAAGSLDSFTAGGSPGSGTVPAVLTAAAADSLGLAIGDTFAVDGAEGSTQVELAATVEPSGADAAFLDPVPEQGTEVEPIALGIPPGQVARFSAEPKIQWVFTIDPASISAAVLPDLNNGLASLAPRMLGDPGINTGGVIPSGQLAGVLADAADATQGVRAVVPVALILLVVLSSVTLVQFARLMSGARAVEDALIGARGASTGQRCGVAATEIVPLAVVGATAGWAAAVVLAPLLSAQLTGTTTAWLDGVLEFAATTWPVPVACVLAATGVFVGVALVDSLRNPGVPSAVEAGRGAKVASFGVLALVVAVTGVSVWQFLLYQSPLSQTSSGAVEVNPLAAPAPAMLLLAFTALALLLTLWGARTLERLSAGRRGLGFPLAARQVSRRIAAFIIPIALVTVTVGSATFTAAYAQTTSGSQQAASQLANGSDVRVSLPGPAIVTTAGGRPSLDPYASLDSVSAASLVYRGGASVSSVRAPLLAVDAAELPGLMTTGSAIVDAGALSTALSRTVPAPEPALALQLSATQVRLQFSSNQVDTAEPQEPDDDDATPARQATLTAWIRSGNGFLSPVPAGTLTLSGPGAQAHSVSFNLPEGLRPTAIAAIDIALEAHPVPQSYSLELTSVASDAGIGSGDARFTEDTTVGLAPGIFGTAQDGVVNLDDGVGVTFPLEGATVNPAQARLMPNPDNQQLLPVAVGSELLADLDLSVGDEVSVRPGGTELTAVVAGAVPVIPGSTESAAVMADLQALGEAWLGASPTQPRPGEIWLAAGDRDAVVQAAAGIAGTEGSVSSSDKSLVARFLTPAAAALWLGTIGALVIGGVALTASVVTLVQSRQHEVAVLRALGMQARDQACGRRWELFGVGAAAVVLGLVAGLAVAAVMVSLLAEAVLGGAADSLSAPLRLAVVPLGALLLAQLVILAVAGWFYGERVHRQALGTV
ncbi:FtsX-like permease family protein [Arthrobacter sp. H5]|uniref:ABC transporter permease n=1 Tax=Arthrobacter sp. H5 TaxID=1267973 RepID=UPI00048A1F49|nr:FtsX-like permease family protein [Arthrobacter sp. H5]